jgi:hypothetical protein
MTAFLYVRAYRANISIFLIFKALYDLIAYVVAFNQLKVIIIIIIIYSYYIELKAIANIF